MKKLILTISALIIMCLSLPAQDRLYIILSDGSYASFDVNDVEKICFKNPESSDPDPSIPSDLVLNEKEIWTSEMTPFKLTASYNSDKEEIVQWSSTNTSVATVDDNGTVTPCGYGKTTIFAAIEFGTGENKTSLTASCHLVVFEPLNSAESVQNIVNKCYATFLGLDDEWNLPISIDPYKAAMFTGQHPTLDLQTSGWDKDYNNMSYSAENSDFTAAYRHAYHTVSACNVTIKQILSNESASNDYFQQALGEAYALRGYSYFWLATTFGRVPIVDENSDTFLKPKAISDEEMWDFIILNFQKSADLLSWDFSKNLFPYSCTKGMALSYLGDSYMWKAYWCPEQRKSCFQKAKDSLSEVINSGAYELQKSFSTLWDFEDNFKSNPMEGYLRSYDRRNNKESVFQIVLFEGDKWGQWGDIIGTHGWTGFYWGPTSNGSWGSFQFSWELYDAFEVGDKRRDASLVTASVSHVLVDKLGKEKWYQSFRLPKWEENNSQYIGVSPEYTTFGESAGKYDPEHPLGLNPFNQEYVKNSFFKWGSYEPSPTVYSLKHWRNGRGTHWGVDLWLPDRLYLKRYANVLLDYAECCFMLDDESEGWKTIDILRNRAFGNTEVGYADELNSIYAKTYGEYAEVYDDNGYGKYVDLGTYPIPFATEYTDVPSAKDYYISLKYEKGFQSPVWKVAVNEERRKEFSAESCLRPEMIRSGYFEDHLKYNYPKVGYFSGDAALTDWETYKDFEFRSDRLIFPFPNEALIENTNLEQNPGY